MQFHLGLLLLLIISEHLEAFVAIPVILQNWCSCCCDPFDIVFYDLSCKQGCPQVDPGRVYAQPGTDPTKSGFEKTHSPPTAGVNGSGRSDFNGCSNGSVSVKNMRKRRRTARKLREKPRSGENLIGIYEISSDSALISPDSMRFRQIRSKFRWIYMKQRLNLGFLTGIWNFLAGICVFARLWVFRRSVRVFEFLGERNRNRSTGVGFWWRKSAVVRQSRSDRFRSSLRVGRVTGYVWTALLASMLIVLLLLSFLSSEEKTFCLGSTVTVQAFLVGCISFTSKISC